MLALGLAAYPAVTAHGALRVALGLLGGGAVSLLLGALLARSAAPLPWAIGLLGLAATAAMLAGGARVERAAPLYGPGLLLAAELAYWALDAARLGVGPPGMVRRRAVALLALVAASAALAWLLALAAGLAEAGAGLEVRMLGVGAAVVVAWVVAALARRPSGG